MPKNRLPNVRIDTFAYSNRWRQVHPGEKGLFTLFCLTAALLSKSPLIPLVIAAVMALITMLGAGVPWREYLRLMVFPVLISIWSGLSLAVNFSGSGYLLASIPGIHQTVNLNSQGIALAELTLARSLGATSSLLFLALTTPMTEIMGLLRSIGIPRLLIELMTITYRQIFVFLEIARQIRAAQEARLGYKSARLAMKSLAGLAGSILIRTISRSRKNYQGLLARGYDSKLQFLSPRHRWSFRNLISAAGIGTALIILALFITP